MKKVKSMLKQCSENVVKYMSRFTLRISTSISYIYSKITFYQRSLKGSQQESLNQLPFCISTESLMLSCPCVSIHQCIISPINCSTNSQCTYIIIVPPMVQKVSGIQLTHNC